MHSFRNTQFQLNRGIIESLPSGTSRSGSSSSRRSARRSRRREASCDQEGCSMRTVQDRERTRRPTGTTLKRLTQIVGVLLCGLLLTGCLTLTLNHPRRTADGTLVVFLHEDGGYCPVSWDGVLHLVRDGERVPIPAASHAGLSAVLDLSPDEGEALYITQPSTTRSTTLYRVALHPQAVPQAVLETTDLISRAFWVDENSILLLRLDDEDLGTLEMLDLVTGRLEPLAGNLLSFAWLPAERTCVLLEADLVGSILRGSVVRWDPATGFRETLASFVLHESTPYSFLSEPDFMWDVSPDGLWVALCLYDANLLDPVVCEKTPSLYLIDVAQESASRIAVDAFMPSFSPDGTSLVYLAVPWDAWDERSVAMWRDLRSAETIPVPGSEGAEFVFWLSPTTLGLTFEDGRYLLIEIDPATRMFQILLD
ncbi:MAG: hypothetical protein EA384_05015 [Spirochaetaceae bacterium]|nr:MAG: hypothetical protein EA384_05015 [Spirochaetaceae bacterium]